jgi:site-specific DNA-methyltransferase (adenine-specific)
MLLKGNCLETLKTLDTASVDSIVTDPPYELGFMGKSWDNSGIAYSTDLWAECLRVLKPGGHLLAFSSSRTYHRIVVAIEDSGFEIRDQIMWLYGSGFPKSLDVSKAIDKAAGAKREVTATKPQTGAKFKAIADDIDNGGFNDPNRTEFNITAPATPEAQQWQGWGTALKPAHEPIVVARKPLIGTVANNVLTYGTGALNIDGSRVGTETIVSRGGRSGAVTGDERTGAALGMYGVHEPLNTEHAGRWPANVIHDGSEEEWSRFFYCAKASKSERNAGLEGLPENLRILSNQAKAELKRGNDDYKEDNGKLQMGGRIPQQNFHPTVKPLALMRYLIKLVTPPGGIVLDPFLGSGTTAVAATLEGFDWIGCEMTEDYWPIIEARVEWAQNERTTTLF